MPWACTQIAFWVLADEGLIHDVISLRYIPLYPEVTPNLTNSDIVAASKDITAEATIGLLVTTRPIVSKDCFHCRKSVCGLAANQFVKIVQCGRRQILCWYISVYVSVPELSKDLVQSLSNRNSKSRVVLDVHIPQ